MTDLSRFTATRFTCFKRRHFLLVAALVLAIAFSPLQAQSEAGSSGLEGVVFDTDARPVAGARVIVRNAETGYSRAVVADSTGAYLALLMPVGTYTIEAEGAPGTAELKDIELSVGNRRTVNLILAPAAGPTAPLKESLESREAASGSSLGLRAVMDLPIRGRNFPELVKLTPAVLQESDRLGLIIAGQRSINSNLSIDGSDFNDPLQGNQRGGNESVFFFPQVAVREFQVVRSGLSVEVGRTNAGFVNVVTKSGGNSWHGEAFFFNRNRRLTSADAFDRELDNRQNHFGGALSGPFKRDQAFFFVGAEQDFLRVPFYVKFAAQPAAGAVPADLQALEGEQAGTNNPTAVFARTDYILNDRDSLNISYSFSRQKGENFNRELGPDQAATTNFMRQGESHGLRVSLASIFSANLLNEVRSQVATDDRNETPNQESPQILITGFGAIGGDSGRPRAFETNLYQVTDNLSANAGDHQLRVGGEFRVSDVFQRRINYMQGRYEFKSLADYTTMKISRYRQALPGPGVNGMPALDGAQQELALYLQDKIALRRDLAFTAGLRWEAQWNPQPDNPNPALALTTYVPDDLSQWQPRIGLAWGVGSSNRTVLRMSSGLFDAHTPATLFQRIFTENGLATVLVDSKTDKNVLNYVKFPGMLSAVPQGIKLAVPQVLGIDANFRNPRSLQTAATIEHMLRSGTSFSVGYTRNSTWNLQRRVDRNLFPPTIDATGMPIFPKDRPNPAIGRFSINESSAHSSYDGLIVTVITPMKDRVNLQANYTLSRTRDDDSNERNFSREPTLNPFDLSLERAYSKQDVRHAFNLISLIDLPGRMMFSTILLARSGFPYTPIIGFDIQNDGNDTNDRAVINGRVVGRNSYREPSFFNLDFRVVKAFRLNDQAHVDVIAEAFNVTRALNKNYGVDSVSEFGTPDQPSSTAGLPLFAPGPGQFGGPRQLQLGVRVAF